MFEFEQLTLVCTDMGGTQAVEIVSQAEALSDFQLLGVEENDRLGDVSLYRHKQTGDINWVKDLPIEGRDQEVLLDEYVRSEGWKQNFFITSALKKIGKEAGSSLLCSASCAANLRYGVFMDYMEKDLQTEIEQRVIEADGPEYFPEAEIWYMVETFINLEMFVLLKQNRFHHDLRTCTVFVADNGQMKFADPALVDPNTNGYFKVLMKQARCNLSPEYLQSLNANQREPKSNPELAEVFAIGIVLLSACSLETEASFYDWEAQEIRWKAIAASIEVVKSQYSELLAELITNCLKERAADRLLLGQITGYLERRRQEQMAQAEK